MSDLQRQTLIHDNVYFDVVVLSSMVRAASIDSLNPVVVRDNHVDQLADVVLRCRLANKQPDMVEGIGSPGNQDQETDENSTDRVDIPDDAATDDRHGKTKGIDDNVIAMVDEEDVDSGVTPIDEAVDAQGAFAEDGCRNEGNGDDVELLRFRGSASQGTPRFDLVTCQ